LSQNISSVLHDNAKQYQATAREARRDR